MRPRPGRTCPVCGRRWSQRDARYCGRCGAALDPLDETVQRRGVRRPRLAVLVTVGGIAALLAVLGTGIGGLPVPPRGGGQVTFDGLDPDEATTLTEDEAEELRRSADRSHLGCEPRGCERWRLDVADLEVARSPASVAEFGDLLVVSVMPEAAASSVGERALASLVAFDATTGERRWERTFEASGPPVGPAVVFATSDGPVLAAGGTVIGLTVDGEPRWRAEPTLDDRELDLVDAVVEYDDTVVVTGWASMGGGAGVVGLASDDGHVRWTVSGRQTLLLPDDVVVLVDDERRLLRVDPATGAPTWEGATETVANVSRLGDHLAASIGEDDEILATLVVDPHTGAERSRFAGRPMQLPVPVDGGSIVLTMSTAAAEPRGWDEGEAWLQVIRVDDDGSVPWRVDLGRHEAGTGCCELLLPDHRTASVTLDAETRHLDVETGERVTGPTDLGGSPAGAEPGSSALEVGWSLLPADERRVTTEPDRRTWRLRADDGQVTISGATAIWLASWQEPVFGDGDHLIGVEVVAGRASSSPPT